MTTWRMRIVCLVRKATHTLRLCNIYCFSTVTIVARRRLGVILYVLRLSFLCNLLL